MAVLRVDQTAGESAPEYRTIPPAHAAFGAESAARCHDGVGGTGQFPIGLQVGIKALAALPNELFRRAVAKNFRVTQIAANHLALADERNARASAVQQGLLFSQGTF